MRDFITADGQPGDPKTAYKKNVWVYASVRAVFNGLNGVPWFVRNEATQKKVDKLNPWYRVLLRPNPLMECMQVWKKHVILFETRGECFWLLYDGNMQPVGMDQVPDSIWVYGPDRVKPNVDAQTQVFKGWKYQPRLDREEFVYFQPWQVLRFFDVDPENDFKGMTPATPAEMSIKVQAKAMGFNDSYLDNGAKLDGVINIDAETYQSLGEDGIELMQERFQDRHAGYKRNGKTPIIAGGEFKPTGSGPKDMDFKSLSEWTREEIVAAWGVPAHQVGLTKNLNLATSTEESKLFFTNNVIPKLKYFASVLNNRLLLGTGLEFYWDEHAIKVLQDSLDSKVLNADSLVNKLGYALNEVNQKLELGMEDVKQAWANTPVDPRTLNLPPPPPPPDKNGNGGAGGKDTEGNQEIKHVSQRDLAHDYWYDVVRPVENRMRPKVVSYWLRLKKEQLALWDAKFGKDAAAPGRKMSDDEIRGALFDSDKWDTKLRDESLPFHRQAFDNSIAFLREEIDTFYHFKPGSNKVANLLAEKNSKITQVNDTFKARLLASLAEGVQEGENIPQLRQRIVEDFTAKINTANNIARTETAQAANMVRNMAMDDEFLMKEWLNANDDHVREHHKKFGLLGPKEMAFEYAPGLKFPCDPDCDDASEVCECRCFEKAVRRPIE